MSFHSSNLTGFDGSTFPNFVANMPTFSSGDAVYAFMVQDSGGTTITPPTGWSQTSSDNYSTAGWADTVKFFELTGGATGSTASTYTWTSSSGTGAFIWIGSFSGRDVSSASLTVLGTNGGNPLLSAPVTATATGITASNHDDLCSVFYLQQETSTDVFALSTPTGFALDRTDLAINGGFWDAITVSKDNISAGSTGTISSTLTQSTGASRLAWFAYVFSVQIAGPVITTQPMNTSAFVGNTATFTVAATGTGGLSYQWTENGSNVGTNSSTYTTGTLSLSDNFSAIACTVTDSNKSQATNTVTLSVIPTASVAWFV